MLQGNQGHAVANHVVVVTDVMVQTGLDDRIHVAVVVLQLRVHAMFDRVVGHGKHLLQVGVIGIAEVQRTQYLIGCDIVVVRIGGHLERTQTDLGEGHEQNLVHGHAVEQVQHLVSLVLVGHGGVCLHETDLCRVREHVLEHVVDDNGGKLLLGELLETALMDLDGEPKRVGIDAIGIEEPLGEVLTVQMDDGHVRNQIVINVVHIDGVDKTLGVGDGLKGILQLTASDNVVTTLEDETVHGQQQVGHSIGANHIGKLLSAGIVIDYMDVRLRFGIDGILQPRFI